MMTKSITASVNTW